MSAFPHLSNTYHCRNVRLAIERERKQQQQNPPGTSGGTLSGLADAVRSIKLPFGIEIAEKFPDTKNKNIVDLSYLSNIKR